MSLTPRSISPTIFSTPPPSPKRQKLMTLPESPNLRTNCPELNLEFPPLRKERQSYHLLEEHLLPYPTTDLYECFLQQVGNMMVYRKKNGQFIGRTEPFGPEYTIINNPTFGFLGFNPTVQCTKTSSLEEVHINTKPAKPSINNPPAQLNKILEIIGIEVKKFNNLQTYKSSDGTTVTLDRSSHPPTIKS